MISQAERSNFLRQCWRTGHWRDGVGTLLLPLRLSLYQFRKEILRPGNAEPQCHRKTAKRRIAQPLLIFPTSSIPFSTIQK